MPLPTDPKTKWPPDSWKAIYDDYKLHDAWFSGDPTRLANVYYMMIDTSGAYPLNKETFDIQNRQAFWARRANEERRTMLHLPIAGDISSTSADMLFSNQPKIRIPGVDDENPGQDLLDLQDRLDFILQNNNVFGTLLEAAEVCSALGGVLLKVDWVPSLAPHPILSIAQADMAYPEFRLGILTAVTLSRIVAEGDRNTVYRHLERHEPGLILNGLYKGTSDTLGSQIPLTALSETANLEETVTTGLKGLAIRYIPNRKPNRKHRGTYLGQSDYAGSETFMDSIDESYTSLMRDVRLGQARIIAPEYMFEYDKETGIQRFDIDKELFVKMSIPLVNGQGVSDIEKIQFDIRTQQHLETCMALLERVITHAGYSPQSFGLEIQGSAESGTALRIREQKSFQTTAKKALCWKNAIEDLLEIMLKVDAMQFKTGLTPIRPQVEMQDSVPPDPNQVATTIEMLNRAQAIRTETKVRMFHPDWNEDQIQSEVEGILNETGIGVPSLEDLGGGNDQTTEMVSGG